MTVFPAPGGVLAAIAIVASSLLLFAGGYWLPIVLSAAALAIACACYDAWWLYRHYQGVQIGMHAPESAQRGDTFALELRLRNPYRRPIELTLRPLLPDQAEPNDAYIHVRLGAESAASEGVALSAPKRGEHTIAGLYARMLGPCRLMRGQWHIAEPRVCKVFPDIRAVKQAMLEIRMRTQMAPHVRTTRLRGIGSEFESLRDYQQGDDIRRIDWRATARLDRPIVREYEIEHERNVVVVLDCGRLMAGSAEYSLGRARAGNGESAANKLDHAIDATLMIGGVALESGDHFGVLAFAGDVRAWLPPRGGMAQLQRAAELLYDMQPTTGESHFRRAFLYLQQYLTKRSLVLIVSDVIDVHASRALMAGSLAMTRRHLVVMAAMRTPEIEAVIDEPSAGVEQPYQKAVAHRLLRERAEVMARMHRGGVEILDIRPGQLTIPLVNKYLELRERNRL